MQRLVLIVHNVRSAHNVGSLLRTADGLGVDRVYMTGYAPYPARPADDRLPHIADRVSRQIHKTALGAEETVSWEHMAGLDSLIPELQADGFIVLALEQTPNSIDLPDYKTSGDVAVIVGNEIEGLDNHVLSVCDDVVAIPMAGHKESFNVAAAGAIALYHLKYRAAAGQTKH